MFISDLFAPGVTSSQLQLDAISFVQQHPLWSPLFADPHRIADWSVQLVQSHSPLLAQHLLTLAVVLGSPIKSNLFERVVYTLAQHQQWQHVLAVIAIAKQAIGSSSTRLLNWRVTALVKTQSYAKLDNVLSEFVAEARSPTLRTFQILVQGHLRNHDINKARHVLHTMKEHGFVDDALDAVVVSAYRGFGPDKSVQDKAFALLQRSNSPVATLALNGLIRLFLDRNDLNGALRVIKLFKRTGREERDGNFPRTRGLRDDATDEHGGSYVRPRVDVATYTMLLDFAAKRRDKARLFDFVNRVKSSQIIPDSKLAAAIIRAYYALNLESNALNVAYEICASLGLNISDSQFAQLCSGTFVTARCFENYKGTLTVDVFNALLQGALERRGVRVVANVLRLMRTVQVRPNASTLEIVASYFFKLDRLRWRDVARAIRILLRHDIQPTLHFSQLLASCAIRHQKRTKEAPGWHALMAKVSRKQKQMNPKGRWAHRRTKNGLAFEVLCGTRLPRTGKAGELYDKVLRSLQDRGINPDRASFAIRMQQDATLKPDPASMKRLLRVMIERGMHPTPHHFASLLQAHTARGDMRGALASLREAREYNIHPNVVHFTILIHGYAHTGRPDLALQVFRRMLHSGVEPDAAAVDAVTGAFFAVGAFNLARRVLLDLWPMVAPFPERLRLANLETLAKALRAMQNNYKSVTDVLVGDHTAAAMTAEERTEKLRRYDRKLRIRIGDVVRQWRWNVKYGRLSSKLARKKWRETVERQGGG